MALTLPARRPARWSMTPMDIEICTDDFSYHYSVPSSPRMLLAIDDIYTATIDIPPDVNRIYKVGPWRVTFGTSGMPFFAPA